MFVFIILGTGGRIQSPVVPSQRNKIWQLYQRYNDYYSVNAEVKVLITDFGCYCVVCFCNIIGCAQLNGTLLIMFLLSSVSN